MSGFMKILEAANLVKRSEESPAQDLTPRSEDPVAQDFPPVQPPQVTIQLEDGAVVEGRALEEIFASANLPASPFPAERLLRLLEGLRAMDDATREAAVKAMDGADDTWTITDPVSDAQLKIGVLESYQDALHSRMVDAEERVVAQVAEMRAAQEHTVTEIRKQIAEFEQLLDRERKRMAEHIVELEAGLKATCESTAREIRRITLEIDKLREIPMRFASQTTQ